VITPPAEKGALQELKERDDIVIKSADKGSAIVVMDKVDYLEEANRQLMGVGQKLSPLESIRISAGFRSFDDKLTTVSLTLKQISAEHHVSNLRAYIANNIIPKGLHIKLTPQSTGWKLTILYK
jgi:hypothetical protein